MAHQESFILTNGPSMLGLSHIRNEGLQPGLVSYLVGIDTKEIMTPLSAQRLKFARTPLSKVAQSCRCRCGV